jgi:hypothetical protein
MINFELRKLFLDSFSISNILINILACKLATSNQFKLCCCTNRVSDYFYAWRGERLV